MNTSTGNSINVPNITVTESDNKGRAELREDIKRMVNSMSYEQLEYALKQMRQWMLEEGL